MALEVSTGDTTGEELDLIGPPGVVPDAARETETLPEALPVGLPEAELEGELEGDHTAELADHVGWAELVQPAEATDE